MLPSVGAPVLAVAATLLATASAFAQAERLTLKSWTACPTIEHTNDMLIFDSYSAVCERIQAGSRVIVERAEQAPATRLMCIDYPDDRPGAHGVFTMCSWHTFQDEPTNWLCARSPNATAPCKWGPAEYFTG